MKRSPFVICYLLFVISAGAGHAQSPVGVQEPAWSADGKRVAVSYLDRIWTMTADGKQARAVTQALKPSSPQAQNESVIEREPAWSGDGTKLAYAADRGDGFDIYVVTVKNGIGAGAPVAVDRKSTRLNSSHLVISYAVFCLRT